MTFGRALFAVALAYGLGSVPTGVLIGRAFGSDPRGVGSGRTGGTNVYRAAGMPAALLTVVGDILKGFLAVAAASYVMRDLPSADLVMSVAALAVILGHNYSIFLGFTGGAGSTPNLGALLMFDPILSAVGLLVGAVILFSVRIASMASLTVSAMIALGLTVRVVAGQRPAAILVYGFGQFALLAWALRPNIKRLRAGEERRIRFGGSGGDA